MWSHSELIGVSVKLPCKKTLTGSIITKHLKTLRKLENIGKQNQDIKTI